MLAEHEIPYRYREYRKKPLSETELRRVFDLLRVGPRELLRTRDRAMKEAGLSGDEADSVLIAKMAEHPTLLQRPIGVLGDRAVVGRPPEKLLELADGS